MQIEITAESLLKQLKLTVNESTLSQMHEIMTHTKSYDHFFKHLFAFNDALALVNGFIAPSSSHPYLKIKFHGGNQEREQRFHETVQHWGEKYKVDLEKVADKETYYIKGQLS